MATTQEVRLYRVAFDWTRQTSPWLEAVVVDRAEYEYLRWAETPLQAWELFDEWARLQVADATLRLTRFRDAREFAGHERVKARIASVDAEMADSKP